MQKVIKILEEYVQWIAIGLGVLFCGLMLWSYVIQPPAKVTIGSETLTPGEVDGYTLEKVATPLQTAMQTNTTIKVPVPSYVKDFEATMAWKKSDAVALNGGS